MPNRPHPDDRVNARAVLGSVPMDPWTGDGHGSPKSSYVGEGHGTIPLWSSERNVTVQPSLTPPSGDGQGNQAVWSGNGRVGTIPQSPWLGDGRVTASTPVPTLTGNGQAGLNGVGLSEDIQMRVNLPGAEEFVVSDHMTKQTPASETWKLVFLVLIFLVWVTTASTLLFMYMDRYLFPG